MPEFLNLSSRGTKPPPTKPERTTTQYNAKKLHVIGGGGKKRGCEYCPLNKVKGINKIFGKVRGKKIFIWAQSPGMQENKAEKELVGPSGQWLWEELNRVGIKREDCDIQNVVRCVPADRVKGSWPPLKMRSPAPEEIKCCSIYNEEALEKSKAKLHLVFGATAAAILLKREYKKDKRVFYSDNLNAWVVYLDHPSYFIRQGYSVGDGRPANASLTRFREDLQKAKQLLKKDSFDRFGFLKKQNYIGITTRKAARKAYKKLKKYALKGGRLVADMEEGKINERRRPDSNGTTVALCCGFAARAGTSYTFALEHPDAPISERGRVFNRKIVQKLVQHSDFKKSAHYLPYDSDAIKRLLDVRPRNFDYDTLIGEFFRDPNAKAYGLAAIVDRRYSDFLGYKDIRYPEAFPEITNKKLSAAQTAEQGEKQGKMNLAYLPWKKMVLYNGADCHVEKLVELDTNKFVNPPLMRVYVDASHMLYRMQREKECLPSFDYKWHKSIDRFFTLKHKKLRRKLKKLAGKYSYVPNAKTGEIRKLKFNPDSPMHIIWLIYTKLRIPVSERDGKNTRANTLLRLAQKYPKARLVVQYREISKIKSTYIDGYYACAKANAKEFWGRLRTIWKLTGTRTGRMSSGRSKDSSDRAVINFQNVHGDPFVKCMMVVTNAWRKLYKYWLKFGDFTERTWKKFKDIAVELGIDFSQHELRCLAQKSKCKALIKIFSSTEKWFCDPKTKGCGEWHSADPHVDVGHALTGWSKGEIYHNERVRKLVKNMQFGLVYGLQGDGLYHFLIALGVKTTREEVDKYHKKYFKMYPEVKEMQDSDREIAEKTGYCETLTGLRRRLMVEEQKEAEDSGEREGGAWWGNQAINTPLQGTAHHILLMSIAELHRSKRKYPLLQYIMKEIHDACYHRIKLKDLWNGIKQAVEVYTKVPLRVLRKEFKLDWQVPFAVKFKAGFRFGVMIEGIEKMKPWEFLNAWCKENHKLEKDFKKQMAELVA